MPEDLHRAAAHINQVKKQVNLAHGWTRNDDSLPLRLLQDPGEGAPIDPAWLHRQISAYYSVRGWDAEGRLASSD